MSFVRLVAAATLVCVTALAIPAVLSAPASAAAVPAELCAQTQSDLGLIDEQAFADAGLSIIDQSFDDFDDFVFSKSGVDPDEGQILTTSFVEPDPALPVAAKQIRCKVRTGESLVQGAWPDGSPNNSPGFERPPFFGFGPAADGVSTGKGSCRTVNQRTLDDVWSALSPEQQEASAFKPSDGTLVTVPDQEEAIGPLWTSDFEPTLIENGVLSVRSKSLYAPTTDTSGIGPRFLGAHYCTLVAPEYLAAVIAANSAPIPSPTPTSPQPTPSATTPSLTPEPTDVPTASLTPSQSTTQSESASDDLSGGSGASLPATGAPVALTSLLGAAVVVLGALLVGRARTRLLMAAGPGRHRARSH